MPAATPHFLESCDNEICYWASGGKAGGDTHGVKGQVHCQGSTLGEVDMSAAAQGLLGAAGDYTGAWMQVRHLRAPALLIPTSLLLY